MSARINFSNKCCIKKTAVNEIYINEIIYNELKEIKIR